MSVAVVLMKEMIDGLHAEQAKIREKHTRLEARLEQRIKDLELLGMNVDSGPSFVAPQVLSNAKALEDEERRGGDVTSVFRGERIEATSVALGASRSTEVQKSSSPGEADIAQKSSSPGEASKISTPAEVNKLLTELGVDTSHLATKALRGIPDPAAAVQLQESKAPPRRLGGIYGNVAAQGSATATTGCVTVDLSSAVTIDMNSATACNSNKCPPCFIVATAHATNALTLQKCSTAKVSNSVSLGGSGAWQNAIMEIIVINAHTTDAIITDGQTSAVTNIVGAKSVSVVYCYTGGSNALYFPSPYFNNGLHTGSGASGTGATITAAGALELDSTLTVTGVTTLNGNAILNEDVTLGSATGDGIVFKGSVTASGNPNIDFSGSGGDFKTTTGTASIGTSGNVICRAGTACNR